MATGCREAPAPEDAPVAPSRLSALLRGEPGEGFALADRLRPFDFPADHGPHPSFRNEWWYFTGNLETAGGRRFGYELTIFRFALAPASGDAQDVSSWRSRQVFVGHFAVTDVAAGRFFADERFSRGALGLAGATPPPVRVWVESWSLDRGPGGDWRLEAGSDGASVSLTLTPGTGPVLNGRNGLSRKSDEPGDASYYYSLPRLATRGTVTLEGGTAYAVTGLSWLDREWGSRGLSAEQAGWDWFALQLDDGSSLMFYRLRRLDGGIDAASAGTWVPADGPPVHLARDDVTVEVRDHWDSPRGGRYPNAWMLEVRRPALELAVEPVLDAQELDTGVRYWEGAVDVRGRRDGRAVHGRGYVELTGYAQDED